MGLQYLSQKDELLVLAGSLKDLVAYIRYSSIVCLNFQLRVFNSLVIHTDRHVTVACAAVSKVRSNLRFFSCSKVNGALKLGQCIRPVTLAQEPYASVPPWNITIPPSPECGGEDSVAWGNLFSPKKPKPCIIDVRSPAEFEEDHIPGAVSLPVLDNRERAYVGCLHSKGNILKARILGASLVCGNLSRILQEFASRCTDEVCPPDRAERNGSPIPPDLLIYCWRGGQRSRSLAVILAEIGWPASVNVLVGGYKSWRRLVLRQLDAWPRWRMPGQVWVISGLTGSGKSMVLEELSRVDENVLDLEKLADHKGSLFGANPVVLNEMDCSSTFCRIPTTVNQRQFESKLHNLLTTNNRFEKASVVWIECESRSVGPLCHLSDGLWERLRAADPQTGANRIWLDIPEEARVAWILEDYSSFTRNPKALNYLISLLAKYQPAKRIAKWREWADQGDFESLVTGFLRDHYDPLYHQSRDPILDKARKNGLVHHVNLPSVDRSAIRNQIIPQLLDLAYPSHNRRAALSGMRAPSLA
ncbi:unnamed protein product [Calicophoron daubneyi]|uniref:Rhodanese domain-containing protein n=1 Tax=Calicophoron daubneyi TaxID=300641 RepID=A0AAV2TJM3_CALDB